MSFSICNHCDNSTRSSRGVARLAGWRFFEGTSQTGKPLSDVVCPTCSGRGTPAVVGFVAHCLTCDWASDEEDDPYDEGPMTAKDAKRWADDHECEPQVEIKAPGDGQWRRPDDFNDDGTLRSEVKEALVRAADVEREMSEAVSAS